MSNVFELSDTVTKLKELNLFPKYVDSLEKHTFFMYEKDNIRIDRNVYATIQKLINEVKIGVDNLISLLNIVLPADNENVVSIMIPNPHDFEDLKKTSETLNKILNMTILNKEIGGSIKIENFDTGSFWVDFLVGSEPALQMIAGLAFSAAVVYKEIQKGRKLEEEIKALQLSNKFMKEISEKCKENSDSIANNEAEFIFKKFYSGEDNEQVMRISLAIKEISKLYEKGCRILPSISAPKEIAEQFPDFNKLPLIESRIKKITNKKVKQ